MAEPSPSADASPEPVMGLEHANRLLLHRRMAHVRVGKFQAVSSLLTLGGVLAFVGVLLLASLGWALVVLSILLIAASVAAYRTLEDE